MQPVQQFFEFNEAIAMTYANAYGRFDVRDNLCGVSFGAVDEDRRPTGLAEEGLAILFGTSNGVPPTSGIQIINNLADDGPFQSRFSLTGGIDDQNLEAALCFRRLFTGRDELGHHLRWHEFVDHFRVKIGLSRLRYSGDVNGKPTIIVTGRNDGVVPLNHSSRPYVALNRIVEGKKSNLRYYEILNANHLDAFIPFPLGFQQRYVPLHVYFVEALNIMANHLKTGKKLPPSQVVRTVPRDTDVNGNVLPLSEENIPPIAKKPLKSDRIKLKKKKGKYILIIPE